MQPPDHASRVLPEADYLEILLFPLQKKHLIGQNEEISSRNASLQTENESLRSELDVLNQDYEVLQEEMSEAKEHYKDLDMSASKITHRCEVFILIEFFILR